MTTTVRTDEEIQRDVLDEFKWDARLQPNEIGVAVKDGVVTLTGWVDSLRRSGLYRLERRYGAFVRTIALPAEVDADNAEAHFRNGVLELKLPKTERSKARQINVNVRS